MTRHSLTIEAVSAGYGGREILKEVDVAVQPGKVTAIVGANACGKSTLLKAMARLIAPSTGAVLLDGKSIHAMAPRQLARQLGLLPQSPIVPEGITVLDLVSRGRHPHRGAFGLWSRADEAAVAEALRATGTADLAGRAVDELSGGQRQRVWIAMALAQETGILLLDEPTTYLDVSHQIDVLDLLVDLNRERGTTIVMVLHELNLATRYADTLVAMAKGRVFASGAPEAVMTEAMIEDVFGLRCRIVDDPVSCRPMMVPIGRHRSRAGSNAAG